MKFIYQLEVSGQCNLRCEYCPHPRSRRKKGLMTEQVIERSLEIVQKLGQEYLCLHNFGEPLLHPMIIDIIKTAKKTVKTLVMSTNGILLTRNIAENIRDAGLSELYISVHDKQAAEKAIIACEGLDILREIRDNFDHDWAGTAARHSEHFSPREKREDSYKGCCSFIESEWAIVLWDGRVNSCCMDMDGHGIIGSIFDEDILQKKPRYHSLCHECNFLQPS